MSNIDKRKSAKPANKYYWVWGLGSVLYIILTLSAPLQANKFNLSSTAIRWLEFSLVIPIILIWWLAFYGAIQFKNYAIAIKDSHDGEALQFVSNGLLVLAHGLILQSVISGLRTQSGNVHIRPFTILSNYVSLVFPIIAFILVAKGGQMLVRLIKSYHGTVARTVLMIVGVGFLACVYTYGLMKNPYRNHTPDPSQYASYYLNDFLLITTIVLPSIVLWATGTLSAITVKIYANHAKGFIYREALNQLVTGIEIVVAFSIGASLLTTIGPSLSTLGFGSLLTLVYVIIALYAVGFIVIASGAKKLTRIEEV